jgi:hypothetical protein
VGVHPHPQQAEPKIPSLLNACEKGESPVVLPVLWIRIKVNSWIRIRLKVISRNRIRIRINLQMTDQNILNMSLFEHFLKGLSLYLEARIRIRIRIRMRILIRIGIRIRIRICIRIRIKVTSRIRIRIRFKVKGRIPIRIRIKVMLIRNTSCNHHLLNVVVLSEKKEVLKRPSMNEEI